MPASVAPSIKTPALGGVRFSGSRQPFDYLPFVFFKLMPTLHSGVTARTAVAGAHFETPS